MKGIKHVGIICMDICLDLRPQSLLDKNKFEQLYEEFVLLKKHIEISEVLPLELVKILVYVTDCIIVQCNFSKKKQHLLEGWIELNKKILELIKPEGTIKIFEIDKHWIQVNLIPTHDKQISKDNVYFLFTNLFQLIMNSDLISDPTKYLETNSLYKTNNHDLLKYWELIHTTQEKLGFFK